MFRNIVVGIDGRRASADALVLAQQLREPDGGRILLAGVNRFFHDFADPLTGHVYAQWLTEQCAQELRSWAEQIPPEVPVERCVLTDRNPAAALNDLAERVHADLIVLGPTHRHRPGKLAGRTIAQRLLHGAPCAVAVATAAQDERFAGPPRILVAYDGSPEAEVALAGAYEIAGATRGSVRVCSVVEPLMYAAPYVPAGDGTDADSARRAAAEARLQAAVARAPEGVAVDHRLLAGPAVRMLLVEALDVDLVVTGSRHYGMLNRAILGSVSAALMNESGIPVLVTPRAAAHAEAAAAPAMATAA